MQFNLTARQSKLLSCIDKYRQDLTWNLATVWERQKTCEMIEIF